MNIAYFFACLLVLYAAYKQITEHFKKRKAVLVIDVQNDFCPGGTLAVPHGDQIIPKINRLTHVAKYREIPAVYSMDDHPEKTSHFKSEENPNGWPVHCVHGTPGAQFHPDLYAPQDSLIVRKGMKPGEDAYSAFDPGARIQGMELEDFLKQHKIGTLVICGLATDYCVKLSVLDARKAGFKVYLVTDAIAAVNAHSGSFEELSDEQKAIAEMVAAGAHLCTTDEAIKFLKK